MQGIATGNEGVTQLADTRPQFDTPLRISIPINGPTRTGKLSIDKLVRNNAFSPSALLQTRQVKTSISTSDQGKIGGKLNLPPPKTKGGEDIINMDHDAQIKTSIKDFSVLAFSSKRAGKRDVEAMAYVSLAIIHDNQFNYEAAMENYLLYLDICEKTGDTIGAACGYNCLGVNCMLLACPPSDAGNLKGIKLTPQSMEYLTKAIHYHTKHLEIGPDEGGRFVATSNVGLCLGMMGDITQSAKYHQDALRISIKMQTLYGQSIAVGNLGYLALIKEDFVTAKTCFEQHLQLVQALLDSEAEIKAWKMLAKICQTEGQFARSVDNLEQAKKIAIKENSFNELKRIHCQIGISKGLIDFSQFSQSLISAIPNDD